MVTDFFIIYIFARAVIFMADFHQRAVLVLEAHAILRILPRCLNPVAATIRVMKRRNAARAVTVTSLPTAS